MTDFEKLKTICRENSEMFRSVVEEFLIHYIVRNEKTGQEANKRLDHYRHIARKFQGGGADLFMTQYIVHRIFKKDGLIKKYLNHNALKRLDKYERSFLEHMAGHPWKFSFSVITGHPAEHFYIMEDVFTGDRFLLYSQGVTRILQEKSIILWFNLIGYNGACWQSYGPIGAYQSFEPDDIFFFATELHPHKWMESGEDIMADVEENPVPYMMLLSGAAYPLTFHKEDQIVQVVAEYDDDSFDTKGLDKHFKIEYADGVYRLTLKRWGIHPHFATAYYDEKRKVLSLSSMTDRGFDALVDRLNAYGYDLSYEPDVRVTLSMIITAKEILGKKISVNEYDSLFIKEPSEEKQKEVKKLNSLFAMVMPEINAGREPDIETMAKKAGVDVKTAREIVEHVMKKIGGLKLRPDE